MKKPLLRTKKLDEIELPGDNDTNSLKKGNLHYALCQKNQGSN